ncbi:MAG: HPP family protein [Gemmatimonadetes bacterium]|jgi:CBS-domain-containing membrane protein|nr:HPP family protein [Gemmatimonadota bacterium]
MQGTRQCPPRVSWDRIGWSGLAAFCGIYAVELGAQAMGLAAALFLIGSFGATAVLIYGAPMAPFSQPRNVMGGHLISAIVGVGITKLAAAAGIEIAFQFAPALAVALAIIAMHLTRTVHPPGGASALIAVIGSSAIHDLGWWYVLCPVGAGAVIMLLVALAINNLAASAKQHYPAYWY